MLKEEIKMKRIMSFILCLMFLTAGVNAMAVAPTPSDVSITVVFNNNSIDASVKANIIKNGGKIITEIPKLGAMLIRGKFNFIQLIQKETSVMNVSPSLTMRLPKSKVFMADVPKSVSTKNADLYNAWQWDIKRVTNNGASFDLESGNHKVVVGIIDTGVNTDQPDLKSNLLGGKNYVPAGGINGTDNTETGTITDYKDRNGHGSHVAGTIAGNGRILGVAPNIGFRSYRVFGAEGGAYTSTIANAMVGAVDDRVDVISMSLGGFDFIGQYWWTDPSTGETIKSGNDIADLLLYKRAIKYAVDHNVTVVAAAGNDGIDATVKGQVTDLMNQEYGPDGYKIVGASFEVPGGLPGVITVSATGPDDSIASYSNYGAGFIDITAPGGDNKRYPEGNWYTDMCLSCYMDSHYYWMDGTSMATPKVSAIAALIICKYGKIGPTKVQDILFKTSQDIGKISTDEYFGYGLANAYNAVK